MFGNGMMKKLEEMQKKAEEAKERRIGEGGPTSTTISIIVIGQNIPSSLSCIF